MTLSELLEELKATDPENELEISDITLNLDQWSAPYKDDIIQGRIQRACERRGWPVVLSFDCDPDHPHTWVAEICDGWALLGMAVGHESPSEALLAAYVAAVKEEKR